MVMGYKRGQEPSPLFPQTLQTFQKTPKACPEPLLKWDEELSKCGFGDGEAERGEASGTCLIMAIHTRLLIRW